MVPSRFWHSTSVCLFALQGRVLLWDIQMKGRKWIDGKITGHFQAFDNFTGQITALDFACPENRLSDTSRFAAMACCDGTIRVASLTDDNYIYTLSIAAQGYDTAKHHCSLQSRRTAQNSMLAANSPCGQWLATVGLSNSMEVQVWDTETGHLVKTCQEHTCAIKVIKWDNTGQQTQVLATGDCSGCCQISIWEAEAQTTKAEQKMSTLLLGQLQISESRFGDITNWSHQNSNRMC